MSDCRESCPIARDKIEFTRKLVQGVDELAAKGVEEARNYRRHAQEEVDDFSVPYSRQAALIGFLAAAETVPFESPAVADSIHGMAMRHYDVVGRGGMIEGCDGPRPHGIVARIQAWMHDVARAELGEDSRSGAQQFGTCPLRGQIEHYAEGQRATAAITRRALERQS